MSIQIKLVAIRDDINRLIEAARRATFKNMNHAGGYIRRVAMNSIKKRKTSSKPGEPPNTQTGRLRRAIRYAVEGDYGVVIGPALNEIGQIGAVHEHGLSESPASLRKPKRTLLVAGTNWKLHVGGHGPIGDKDGTVYIKFASEAQVGKSEDYIESAPPEAFGNTKKARAAQEKRRLRARLANKVINYPERPFMGPALMQNLDRIPALWANSVN